MLSLIYPVSNLWAEWRPHTQTTQRLLNSLHATSTSCHSAAPRGKTGVEHLGKEVGELESEKRKGRAGEGKRESLLYLQLDRMMCGLEKRKNLPEKTSWSWPCIALTYIPAYQFSSWWRINKASISHQLTSYPSQVKKENYHYKRISLK